MLRGFFFFKYLMQTWLFRFFHIDRSGSFRFSFPWWTINISPYQIRKASLLMHWKGIRSDSTFVLPFPCYVWRAVDIIHSHRKRKWAGNRNPYTILFPFHTLFLTLCDCLSGLQTNVRDGIRGIMY